MAPTLWTIGHSTLPLDELVALLERFRMAAVVDVRRFPASRKNPQFDRETLARTLRAREIRYVWMGEGLGGYRRGGYEAHMRTPAFAEALEWLERIAAGVPTAFMCAEKLFLRCHRRFIADALVRRGWRIIHIIDADRTQAHKLGDDAPELPFGT